MGALLRAYDWSRHPLGATERWPQALKTALRLILNTGHPADLFWGEAGTTCFYNDAYRLPPLDRSATLRLWVSQPEQVWEEIWDVIGPQFEQVMAGGGPTWHENQLVPITRHGQREDVYWTYSYSPIR